jgi:intein/homing endonuclease
VSIKDMEDCDNEVLGWNQETNNIIPAKQTGFLYKGERECIQLTFQDGRTDICTPEHPLLNSHNEWVKAKDFKINEDSAKCSVRCPSVDYKEEIKECNGWELKVGELIFKTDTKENYIKSMIFAKILGYLITDETYNSLTFEDYIDLESFKKDFSYIIPDKLEIKKKRVILPLGFMRNIYNLDGFFSYIPFFLFSSPKPIVREFLGGLLGASYLLVHKEKEMIKN